MQKRSISLLWTLSLLTSMHVWADSKFETRCGWIDNRTRGIWILIDKDAEWLMSNIQGAKDYEAEGMDLLPDFEKKDWINVNANHGYGCACLKVKVDKKENKILAITHAKVLPIVQCKTDPSLKKQTQLIEKERKLMESYLGKSL